MTKIYIIQGSKGFYENYTNWIVGAFDNYPDAEKYLSKLNDEKEKSEFYEIIETQLPPVQCLIN